MINYLNLTENFISGMLPFTFLIVSGMYFTYKTRAVQIRKLGKAIKFSLSLKNNSSDGISSLGAMCNSLAATVGTGNIAGVASAISVGGAGAVFWMWVSAFFSMAVKASEITLALKYRKKCGDSYIGGPMYYIKEKLGKIGIPLAFVFSLFCVFSSFTTGNITQVNACVSAIGAGAYIKLTVGVVFGLTVFFVIKGGAKKITKFTTAVLPLMTALYIILCLGVILKNISFLGDAIVSVFKGAISPKAVTGGAVGSVYITLITGAQKGIFSNEAGLGTAALAHTAAHNADAETQGYFGIFEVMADTLLICTLTALTILTSGVIIDYKNVASSELVGNALATLYGGFSRPLLSLMLCLFGVSSVLGWANYGITASRFLKGKNGEKIFIYIYPFFCVVGALLSVKLAWRFADFFNGIMLIINTFAVLYLSKEALFMPKENYNDKKNRKITTNIRKPGGSFNIRRL